MDSGPSKNPPFYCGGCGVARYRNAEHCKRDLPAHRKGCGKPPYRIPGQDEAFLCTQVTALDKGEPLPERPLVEVEVDVVDEDDDGSWESIDSDEEEDGDEEEDEKPTKTGTILKYFVDRTYKETNVEQSGFENLYS